MTTLNVDHTKSHLYINKFNKSILFKYESRISY
jgi:hypothetical protein